MDFSWVLSPMGYFHLKKNIVYLMENSYYFIPPCKVVLVYFCAISKRILTKECYFAKSYNCF
jgi:hypothetical protein